MTLLPTTKRFVPLTLRFLLAPSVAKPLTPVEPLAPVAGTVFADHNANGAQEPGEPGIAGVVVSDQISVAVTDSSGRYSLHSTGYGLVFVSLPDGLRPHSSFYRRLAEPRLDAVDFALVPAPAPRAFTFIHASDTHVRPDNVARVRRVATLSRELDVDFVLVTGDLVLDALRVGEDEARSYYDLYASVLEEFTAPVWNVPGNHEIFGIERPRPTLPRWRPRPRW